jgi:hypothetical protein
MSTRHLDKILLAASAMLFVALLTLTLLSLTRLSALSDIGGSGLVGGVPYIKQDFTVPEVVTIPWSAPAAQQAGAEWVFEVFTPPVIYYDLDSRKFSVTPPTSQDVVVPAVERPFGVELVEVKQTPYRIQLVGYLGTAGDYLITFEDVTTRDTILARVGRTYDRAGFRVVSFSVDRVAAETRDSNITIVNVATAVIYDLREEREVTLTDQRRLMNEELTAVLRSTTDARQVFEVEQGSSVTVGADTFTVVSIEAEPAAVVIERQATDEAPSLTRRLTPTAHSAPAIGPRVPDTLFPDDSF